MLKLVVNIIRSQYLSRPFLKEFNVSAVTTSGSKLFQQLTILLVKKLAVRAEKAGLLILKGCPLVTDLSLMENQRRNSFSIIKIVSNFVNFKHIAP